MNEQEVLEILGKLGAVITDSHIVYTSGLHGIAYVNKDALYPHTAETSSLCRAIAERFVDDNVQVVIAPAIGGVILSQWVAHHLTEMNGHEVLGVYAEKSQKLGSPLWYICFGLRLLWQQIPQLGVAPKEYFVIKRGYDKLILGKRVLVVEDVLTTGGSVKKVVEATRAISGNVIGLGALCNRGRVTERDVGNVPKLIALTSVTFSAWTEEECPLCRENIPINTNVGKGREFLARRCG
ncbi:MAG: phosphoribosyltransferase family protein [bacterium]|nr:phosphoribosyltransferase family protein [bacterium]